MASGSDEEHVSRANLATIEDSNGERQIVQVIREPIEGGIAIAEEKNEGAIYEFEQPQYIAIPNNSLPSLQARNNLTFLYFNGYSELSFINLSNHLIHEHINTVSKCLRFWALRVKDPDLFRLEQLHSR